LHEEPARPIDVSVSEESTGAPREARPAGKRFGTLVHALLATVAFDARAQDVGSASKAQGRAIGATPEEIAAAAEAVCAALQHKIILQAKAAGATCRREAPVLLREDDDAVTEGVLDLAFRTEDSKGPVWVVVDYKTDGELATRRAEYHAQVRRYSQIVAESTGERSVGVILRV
jgi:ATP-dependent exoDNAse (exonuclease V) beta subunit